MYEIHLVETRTYTSYREVRCDSKLDNIITSIFVSSSSGVGAERTMCLAAGFMKPSSTPLSNNVSKGSQQPSMLSKPTCAYVVQIKINKMSSYSIILQDEERWITGFLWIPSCAQVIISSNSSIVPYPPKSQENKIHVSIMINTD